MGRHTSTLMLAAILAALASAPAGAQQTTGTPGSPSAPTTIDGVIPTPALDRIAETGLRYTAFHTTALCSPTRAALLTGRNHHSVGMGGVTDMATSSPGYTSVRPKSKATIAEILK